MQEMEPVSFDEFIASLEAQFIPFDVEILIRQIGPLYAAMISGGKIVRRETGITFPVGDECSVTIDLNGTDLYTVRRIRTTNGKARIHGEQNRVHCDEVARIAYRASCISSPFPLNNK